MGSGCVAVLRAREGEGDTIAVAAFQVVMVAVWWVCAIGNASN